MATRMAEDKMLVRITIPAVSQSDKPIFLTKILKKEI